MLLLNLNHKDEIISILSFLGGDIVKSIDNKRSHSWHTDYIPTSLDQCTHYLLAKISWISQYHGKGQERTQTFTHGPSHKKKKEPRQEAKPKKEVFIPNRPIEQAPKATGVERRGNSLDYLFYPARPRLVILVAKRRLYHNHNRVAYQTKGQSLRIKGRGQTSNGRSGFLAAVAWALGIGPDGKDSLDCFELPGNGNADAEAASQAFYPGTEDIRSSFGLSTSIRSLTPISVDWTTGLNDAPLASLVGKHLRAGAFIWVTSIGMGSGGPGERDGMGNGDVEEAG
ncbi:unnamed protein product [Vicia faba]|uniref:Uncharacterized protein n=1 Tax=Vicia faba TaxID=3906 RepID=A0AAV1AE06_VICFA|nr:unnamed protein product [Vicia faba]